MGPSLCPNPGGASKEGSRAVGIANRFFGQDVLRKANQETLEEVDKFVRDATEETYGEAREESVHISRAD